MSEGFSQIAKADIIYDGAYNKLRFALNTDQTVSPSYFHFLSSVEKYNPNLIVSSLYRNFILAYLDYQYTQNNTGGNMVSSSPVVEKYYMADNFLSGDLLYFIQAKLIMDGSITANPNLLTGIYDDFLLRNTNPVYNETVSNTFTMAKRFAPGSPAPNFSLRSYKGKQVNLHDYKGKVVYIAFWASWCNPCLQQIKYIRDLKQNIDNREVVFLYVSIDQSETSWRSIIQSRNMPGVHVLAEQGTSSAIAQDYNVAGVPLYFVVDKNGNFASKPPLPSHKNDFLKYMNALVSY